MMKIKLDKNNRKFITVEVTLEDEKHELKYYEKNTKQIDAFKEMLKDESNKMHSLETLNKEQFFENLKGEKEVIDKVVDFYQENGNFYDFINSCDEELGKLKKKG